MKTILITAITLSAAVAQARTVNCKIDNNDAGFDRYEQGLILEIPAANAKKITIKAYDENGKLKAYEALLNTEDSMSTDPEDLYHLDEDYNPKKEARFVADTDLTSSDGDSILFVDKTVLKGQAGAASLSSGQPNDGESGPPWLWSRDAFFKCK